MRELGPSCEGYGKESCRSLAEHMPARALINADSYCPLDDKEGRSEGEHVPSVGSTEAILCRPGPELTLHRSSQCPSQRAREMEALLGHSFLRMLSARAHPPNGCRCGLVLQHPHPSHVQPSRCPVASRTNWKDSVIYSSIRPAPTFCTNHHSLRPKINDTPD